MKILIFGLPGSGKTTLAKSLCEILNCIHFNADEIREKYDDWDFSPEGRIRQANRMKYLSDGAVVAGKIVIADFICPTEEAREEFNPDYSIWMNTIEKGKYEDTNKIFQKPKEPNFIVTEWNEDTHLKLASEINNFVEKRKNV
tara:strand:- start:686 stop:1114 length:429 start_codon:yes stop_codon:yes gene_type:complete